jgi:hypothetical protein
MKNFKSVLLLITVLFCGSFVSAQTADEIIAKYLQSMGGKEQISKVNSLYIEGTMDVMGNSGALKMTTLNGKGYKMDVEMMGSVITTCFNDKEGWTVNPMMGSTTPTVMPEIQYKAGKEQIFIGAPFLNYAEKGYKVELMGQEAVGDIQAWKIKMISPENNTVYYFFDSATGYMIRTIQQAEMQGTMVENVMTLSDYRVADGYAQFYKMVMNIGGQFEMTMNIAKVEVNKTVDPAIFAKP